MKSQCFTGLSIMMLSLAAQSADSIYCAQQHGYINVGMTQDQVVAACGKPLIKRDSKVTQVVEKIPVTQLIYTTLNQGGVYPGINNMYQRWSLPSGSTGVNLQVNIIDQKITSVNINGSSTNAASICGGISLQVGDDISRVYSACGNPSLVNQTYINQPVPKTLNPEVWVYQVNKYQPPFSLTFVNGNLQSID